MGSAHRARTSGLSRYGSRVQISADLMHSVLALQNSSVTRHQRAELLKIGTRTLEDRVRLARDQGLLNPAPGRGGRPHALQLGSYWGYVLAVAVGSESCRAGLVDPQGRLLIRHALERLPGQRALRPGDLLERIRAAVTPVLKEASIRLGARGGGLRLLGIATSWPSPVRGSGRPAGQAMSYEWQDITREPLRLEVARLIGCPPDRSHSINDAYAHAIASSYDRSVSESAKLAELELNPRILRNDVARDPRAWRIALTVHIGGAISAATMVLAPERLGRLGFLDSILIGGGRSIAGEIAHIRVSEACLAQVSGTSYYMKDALEPIDSASRCFCGQELHLQAHSSGDAVLRRLLAKLTRDELNEALDHQQVMRPAVRQAFGDAGRILGRTLSPTLRVLDPSVLTLTGTLARQELRQGVVRGLQDEGADWNEFENHLQIEVSPVETNAWLPVRGAALAVLRANVFRKLDHWALTSLPDDLTFNLPLDRYKAST